MSENLENLEQRPFDPNRTQIAQVYAKALLGAAGDGAEAVTEELESLVHDVLAPMPKLDAMLSSPRIGIDEKHRILDTVFADKMNPTLLRFLKVVASHERFDCLREVCVVARSMQNERQGRVEVLVQTAEAIDEGTTETIRQQLSERLGQDVLVESEVNPEIIGGLVVRVGDTVYDGSVAARLKRTRQNAIQNTTQTIRSSLERFSE